MKKMSGKSITGYLSFPRAGLTASVPSGVYSAKQIKAAEKMAGTGHTRMMAGMDRIICRKCFSAILHFSLEP